MQHCNRFNYQANAISVLYSVDSADRIKQTKEQLNTTLISCIQNNVQLIDHFRLQMHSFVKNVPCWLIRISVNMRSTLVCCIYLPWWVFTHDAYSTYAYTYIDSHSLIYFWQLNQSSLTLHNNATRRTATPNQHSAFCGRWPFRRCTYRVYYILNACLSKNCGPRCIYY